MHCQEKRLDEQKRSFIKSPLNYTGGKSRLMSQILPLFPGQINVFVDLFCGGGNVGVNVRAKEVIYNDNNMPVIKLLEYFKRTSAAEIESGIKSIVSRYKLSDSAAFGYEKYGSNSTTGLASFNRGGYLALRDGFNKSDKDNMLELLTLIIFSFNNQIRFNKKGEYNLPVGKRDFNDMIKSNLRAFCNTLSEQNSTILNTDFRNFYFEKLGKTDFVYCDPPYLIATATYNEGGGWGEKDEKDLLEILTKLDTRRIKFALSNVVEHNGRQNRILLDWASRYKVNNLDSSYDNSNYHSSARKHTTKEVLITNF